MVSQRDLNVVIEQINESYAVLLKRIDKLEAKVASNTTKKEKTFMPMSLVLCGVRGLFHQKV